MSLQRIQTNKEFSRDVVVGMVTIVSLFGILIFVAVERFTGRSISPLSYLYAKSEKKSQSAPVRVFATEEDRLAARSATKNQPSFELVAKKLKQITESLKKKSDTEDESVQLASHQGEALEKNDSTNQLIAGNSFPAPPSNRSFQPDTQSTNSSSFNPAPFNPNPSSEVPSKFQPSKFQPNSVETTSLQTTKPPSTSPPVTHPVVVNPFRNQTQVTRFQSPETEFKDNPISQATNTTELGTDAVAAPPTNPNLPVSNSFSPPRSIPAVSKTQNSMPTKSGSESAVVIDSSKTAPASTLSDKRIQPLKEDSFWTIANREYGNGKLFRQLAAYNRCLENSDIMPRTVLIPDLKKLQSVNVNMASETVNDDSNPTSSQPTETSNAASQLETKYVVEKGDTLFEISKQKLGQAVRYVELIRLNQAILPTDVDGETKLKVGIELVMPK